MKNRNWERVRDALEERIDAGGLQPGDQLPTEQQLVEEYLVGRHSIRRAVADLAKRGLLSAEQGRGTFVAHAPQITYALGGRTRLSENLAKQGIDLTRTEVDNEIKPAPDRVMAALSLKAGDLVSVSRRITLADGVPIAFGSSFHSEGQLPGYLDRRAVFGSVTETYKSFGITDYLRGETTLYSRQAKPREARILRQHPEQAVTVIRAVDTLLDGTPIAFSEVIWSAARVKFTVPGANG